MDGHPAETQAWIPALEKLMAGNRRYVAGHPRHPHQTTARRAELDAGQQPFAVVLGCSDSRVPPEVIFDQGLGDLFVVRLAGAVIDDLVLASIEYAVAHLGTPVVMVLGHADCGAITATAVGDELPGHLPQLAATLQEAIAAARGKPGDLINNAARASARMQADQLRRARPIIADQVAAERVKVFAAFVDLTSGVVEIL